MPSNMSLLQQEVPPASIRASAEATSGAIAITDDQLILAKAGLFGWGNKIQRYQLAQLTRLRLSLNVHADLLRVEFGGGKEELTLMFKPDAKTQVEAIARILESKLPARAEV